MVRQCCQGDQLCCAGVSLRSRDWDIEIDSKNGRVAKGRDNSSRGRACTTSRMRRLSISWQNPVKNMNIFFHMLQQICISFALWLDFQDLHYVSNILSLSVSFHGSVANIGNFPLRRLSSLRQGTKDRRVVFICSNSWARLTGAESVWNTLKQHVDM